MEGEKPRVACFFHGCVIEGRIFEREFHSMLALVFLRMIWGCRPAQPYDCAFWFPD
jgi:hypothetical protein